MMLFKEQLWLSGYKATATDLHPVNLGSAPAGTHWWQQEGNLAIIAPVHQ